MKTKTYRLPRVLGDKDAAHLWCNLPHEAIEDVLENMRENFPRERVGEIATEHGDAMIDAIEAMWNLSREAGRALPAEVKYWLTLITRDIEGEIGVTLDEKILSGDEL